LDDGIALSRYVQTGGVWALVVTRFAMDGTLLWTRDVTDLVPPLGVDPGPIELVPHGTAVLVVPTLNEDSPRIELRAVNGESSWSAIPCLEGELIPSGGVAFDGCNWRVICERLGQATMVRIGDGGEVKRGGRVPTLSTRLVWDPGRSALFCMGNAVFPHSLVLLDSDDNVIWSRGRGDYPDGLDYSLFAWVAGGGYLAAYHSISDTERLRVVRIAGNGEILGVRAIEGYGPSSIDLLEEFVGVREGRALVLMRQADPGESGALGPRARLIELDESGYLRQVWTPDRVLSRAALLPRSRLAAVSWEDFDFGVGVTDLWAHFKGSGTCFMETDCGDANPCTMDSCHPIAGCQHAARPDDAECGAGSLCNGGVCE